MCQERLPTPAARNKNQQRASSLFLGMSCESRRIGMPFKFEEVAVHFFFFIFFFYSARFALLEDTVITPQKMSQKLHKFDKEGKIQGSTKWFCVHMLKANVEFFWFFCVQHLGKRGCILLLECGENDTGYRWPLFDPCVKISLSAASRSTGWNDSKPQRWPPNEIKRGLIPSRASVPSFSSSQSCTHTHTHRPGTSLPPLTAMMLSWLPWQPTINVSGRNGLWLVYQYSDCVIAQLDAALLRACTCPSNVTFHLRDKLLSPPPPPPVFLFNLLLHFPFAMKKR